MHLSSPFLVSIITTYSMIQRIQSVYLFVVTVLLVVAMCLPVGMYVLPDGSVATFANWGVCLDEVCNNSVWGMFALLLLSAIVALSTIFLYRNRILQIRMTVFNCLLLVGYYLTFAAFLVVFGNRLDATFHGKWGVCLPLICVILNYLAIRAIGKDEAMVRAADRLR